MPGPILDFSSYFELHMAMLGRAKLKSTIPGVEALKETKDRPGFYQASEIQPTPTDGDCFYALSNPVLT